MRFLSLSFNRSHKQSTDTFCGNIDTQFQTNNRRLWEIRLSAFFMVALCNRETIYIFVLWFVLLLLLLLFFPRLISAAADWMSAILPHMVWP